MSSGSMPLRRGVHRPLEEAADRIIRQSLVGNTSRSDKSDILTPWKAAQRRKREVLVPSADPSVRRGTFTRALNVTRPELNSREGICRPRTDMGLSAFVAEHGGGEMGDRDYE